MVVEPTHPVGSRADNGGLPLEPTPKECPTSRIRGRRSGDSVERRPGSRTGGGVDSRRDIPGRLGSAGPAYASLRRARVGALVSRRGSSRGGATCSDGKPACGRRVGARCSRRSSSGRDRGWLYVADRGGHDCLPVGMRVGESVGDDSGQTKSDRARAADSSDRRGADLDVGD